MALGCSTWYTDCIKKLLSCVAHSPPWDHPNWFPFFTANPPYFAGGNLHIFGKFNPVKVPIFHIFWCNYQSSIQLNQVESPHICLVLNNLKHSLKIFESHFFCILGRSNRFRLGTLRSPSSPRATPRVPRTSTSAAGAARSHGARRARSRRPWRRQRSVSSVSQHDFIGFIWIHMIYLV